MEAPKATANTSVGSSVGSCCNDREGQKSQNAKCAETTDTKANESDLSQKEDNGSPRSNGQMGTGVTGHDSRHEMETEQCPQSGQAAHSAHSTPSRPDHNAGQAAHSAHSTPSRP